MKLLSGSKYIKVDLHSHTQEDKEFSSQYKNRHSDWGLFAEKYVEQLKKENIGIVAITNHNKFDQEEYFLIKENAEKERICVLPGVELSLEEGKRGLHVLCIFPQELANNQKSVGYSFVESFLAKMFNGDRFDPNGDPLPAEKGIREMINLLEHQLKCPYILIMAHVDNSKGCFKELGWSMINQFIREKYMRTKIHGLQGIGNSTKEKFENEISKIAKELDVSRTTLIPAYLEGSDPKILEEVGTKFSWIKLGELSFKALQFALSQPLLRVKEPPASNSPFLKKIKFTTFKGLEKSEIHFNRDLNSLIGIRGSGKSTIIENIRYVFDLQPLDDVDYKQKLISTHLGSGGKIELTLVNKGQEYRVERIFGERPKVFKEEEYIPDLRPTDLLQIIYYGQKDLQKRVQEPKLIMEIIDQYIGEGLISLQSELVRIEDEIKTLLHNIRKIKSNVDRKEEFLQNKAGTELKIEEFKRLNIANQLKVEADYKKDEVFFNNLKKSIKNEKKISAESEEQIKNIIDFLNSTLSESNIELNTELEMVFNKHRQDWNEIFKKTANAITELEKGIGEIQQKYQVKLENVKEKIAKIKREIKAENVYPDDYSKLIQARERYSIALQEIGRYEKKLEQYQRTKKEKYQLVKELWHKLYLLRAQKADEINNKQDIIKAEIDFKGEKKTFEEFLRIILQGSRIPGRKIEKIAELYSDGIEIIDAIENNEELEFLTANERHQFIERCLEQEEALGLFRIEDNIRIFYRGTALENLSLGQRASSLLMLLLTMDDKPLVIDQPEDDLDNQMIYEGLVRELLKLKGQRQFIFATHNSNIPVLGDCEQIIVCDNQDSKMKFVEGSIDTEKIQERVVGIMEGGKDAFEKRKEIYEQWM